jgi:hypothetical protein
MQQCAQPYEQYCINHLGTITKLGAVVRCFNNKKSGYTTVKLFNSFMKRMQMVYVHRLMFLCFKPTIDISRLDIDHIDHVRSHNFISNLRAITHAENLRNRRPFKQSRFSARYLILQERNTFIEFLNIDF